MGIFSYVLPALPALLTCIHIQEYDYQVCFQMLNHLSVTVFVYFFNANIRIRSLTQQGKLSSNLWEVLSLC